MATDKFTNIAHIYVAETAANTFTAVQLSTGIAVFDKTAMVIHRVEYRVGPSSLAELAATADVLEVGLTTNGSLTSLASNQAAVIDNLYINEIQSGTPGNSELCVQPFTHDLSTLPSGGLIMPGTAVYGAIKGSSLGNPCTVHIKLYFSYMELKADDYFELVQATQALTT